MSRLKEASNPVEEARLLMPWYVTGKLSDDDHDFVTEALANYPELEDALAQEQSLVGLVRENTQLLEIAALDSTQQRLDKLLSRIEREENPVQQTAQQQSTPSKQASVSAGNWFKSMFDVSWLTPANAVFASLLAVQMGLVGLYVANGTGSLNDNVYIPASVSMTTPEDKAVKSVYLVDFDRAVPHGQVVEFLANWNARVISGPDGSGMFVIELTTQPEANTENSAEKTIEKMMQSIDDQQTPVTFIGSKFQSN